MDDRYGEATWQRDASDQQQELLLVVVARLSARAGWRGLTSRRRWSRRTIPTPRAELLLRASSIRVPCLVHDGVTVWDTLAIAEYLQRDCPDAGMYPGDRMARARCRSISGEMHSGFSALRSSLPMNLRTDGPAHRRLVRRAGRYRPHHRDLARMPRRPGKAPGCSAGNPPSADAMYAPVVTRFRSYDVQLDPVCDAIATTSGVAGPAASGSPRRSWSRSRSRNWKSSSDPRRQAIFAPRRRRRHRARAFDLDRLEVRRPDHLQVFHVRRVVEQVVGDPRPLMHAVAGGNQMLLAFVHEPRPALQHDDDVEVGDVLMPAGAFDRADCSPSPVARSPARRSHRRCQGRDTGRSRAALGDPWRVARLDVGEFVDDRFVQHRAHSLLRSRAASGCLRPSHPGCCQAGAASTAWHGVVTGSNWFLLQRVCRHGIEPPPRDIVG